MKHQHFDPEANEFFEHEHIHSGPHRHERLLMSDGRIVNAVNKVPGNYAPARKDQP